MRADGNEWRMVGKKVLRLEMLQDAGLNVEFVVESHIFPGCDNWAERGLMGRLFRDLMHLAENSVLRRFGISHFIVARKRA